MQPQQGFLRRKPGRFLFRKQYQVIEEKGSQLQVYDKDTNRKLELNNFSSKDIYGFSQMPKIQDAVRKAEAYFKQSEASYQLFYDRLHLHAQLEMAISSFNGFPNTHLFLNALMATQALIETIYRFDGLAATPGAEKRLLILVDEHNYPKISAAGEALTTGNAGRTLLDGRGAIEIRSYKHADPVDLDKQLNLWVEKGDQIVVFTDSVFSEDGKIAPIMGIISVLSDWENSFLICDETNSCGVLGRRGGGIFDHFDIEPQVLSELGIEPILFTSFSNLTGSASTAISSLNEKLVSLLDAAITSSATSSFSPPEMAKLLRCVTYLKRHPHQIEKMHRNAGYIRAGLQDAGYKVKGNGTAIISIEFDDPSAYQLAKYLLTNHKYWVSTKGSGHRSYLRIIANVKYTPERMDRLITALATLKKDIDVECK